MKKSRIRKSFIILFWIVIWQAADMFISNDIIFVGPYTMLKALIEQMVIADFWTSVFYSFVRICAGFFIAFFSGILLGSLAYIFSIINEFLSPIISLMKSVPVASFVILALIWIGSKNLSVLVSFLIVFPVIYVNMVSGLNSTDKKLLEMADVFHISFLKRILYIYRPAVMPYLINGCKIGLGMSWKSGIAAEVIGVPSHSIGERLYMSKIYLNTAELFAWTFVIIVISYLFEKIFLFFLMRLNGGRS